MRYVPRGDLRSLYRQLIRYGRGRVRLMRKHPGTFSLGTFLPAAFVLGLIAGLPLSFVSIWLAAIYAGTLLLYAAIIATSSLSIAFRHRRPSWLLWLPLVFATIHIGSGAGLLRELLVIRSR